MAAPWCRATKGSACAADGDAKEIHPGDPDVLGDRIVVRLDERDESANVVYESALGLALLDLHDCGVARHF